MTSEICRILYGIALLCSPFLSQNEVHDASQIENPGAIWLAKVKERWDQILHRATTTRNLLFSMMALAPATKKLLNGNDISNETASELRG